MPRFSTHTRTHKHTHTHIWHSALQKVYVRDIKMGWTWRTHNTNQSAWDWKFSWRKPQMKDQDQDGRLKAIISYFRCGLTRIWKNESIIFLDPWLSVATHGYHQWIRKGMAYLRHGLVRCLFYAVNTDVSESTPSIFTVWVNTYSF